MSAARGILPGGQSRAPQRGAALLVAMLTVTLVATWAAAALWQQWRAVEVESAERARVQASWILVGALDWSRLILREDGRTGGPDHLAEPWAVPLEEARLSTFLAAERNVAQADDASTDTTEAFLSGQILDLQARLNLTSLLDGGQLQAGAYKQFARLFERLGLPPQHLALLIDGLRRAQAPATPGGNAADAPLLPRRVEHLGWLGLPRSTVDALAPHVTLLPVATGVNLNTAGVDVLWAALDGLDMAGAQKLVQAREVRHFRGFEDIKALVGANIELNGTNHAVQSRYFEVRGRLRLEQTLVDERSVVERNGQQTRVLWRERGSFDRPVPPPAR